MLALDQMIHMIHQHDLVGGLVDMVLVPCLCGQGSIVHLFFVADVLCLCFCTIPFAKSSPTPRYR